MMTVCVAALQYMPKHIIIITEVYHKNCGIIMLIAIQYANFDNNIIKAFLFIQSWEKKSSKLVMDQQTLRVNIKKSYDSL